MARLYASNPGGICRVGVHPGVPEDEGMSAAASSAAHSNVACRSEGRFGRSSEGRTELHAGLPPEAADVPLGNVPGEVGAPLAAAGELRRSATRGAAEPAGEPILAKRAATSRAKIPSVAIVRVVDRGR